MISLLLAFGMVAVSSSVALAQVSPGLYSPTAGSFNSANAPGSSHLTSGTPECTVNEDLSISCAGYVLGGVGHTNATALLTATYTATINCTNHGSNTVESQTVENFSPPPTTMTVSSTKNGQLTVPPESISPFSAPQVCPNPNWTPSIAPGTLVLDSFDYTLTFAGFTSPYIEVKEP